MGPPIDGCFAERQTIDELMKNLGGVRGLCVYSVELDVNNAGYYCAVRTRGGKYRADNGIQPPYKTAISVTTGGCEPVGRETAARMHPR